MIRHTIVFSMQFLTLLLPAWLLFIPAIASAQPYRDPNPDVERNICKLMLAYHPSRGWDFDQRKATSDTLMMAAATVVQGVMLGSESVILNDTLYVLLSIQTEHFFKGRASQDSVIYVLRRRKPGEGVRLVNGQVVFEHYSHIFQYWRLEEENRYIFFCRAPREVRGKTVFQLQVNDPISYLWQLDHKAWIGLYCMSYLDYPQVIQHFNELGGFIPPSDMTPYLRY
ncbi:MAG: hypothetical protein KDC54_10615 [Lewinella sp.]|nr:hypothetical protein [Lewinella sp.]